MFSLAPIYNYDELEIIDMYTCSCMTEMIQETAERSWMELGRCEVWVGRMVLGWVPLDHTPCVIILGKKVKKWNKSSQTNN